MYVHTQTLTSDSTYIGWIWKTMLHPFVSNRVCFESPVGFNWYETCRWYTNACQFRQPETCSRPTSCASHMLWYGIGIIQDDIKSEQWEMRSSWCDLYALYLSSTDHHEISSYICACFPYSSRNSIKWLLLERVFGSTVGLGVSKQKVQWKTYISWITQCPPKNILNH